MQIKHSPPPVDQFVAFREAVGWGEIDPLSAQRSIENSLFFVSVYKDKQLAGFGRVIGDGCLYFYIQDLVVASRYQGQGVGTAIMTEIEHYLDEVAPTGATVGLLAALGKEGFYQSFGYQARNGEQLGLGLSRVV